MFTTFLLITSIAVVAVLATVLAARWRKVPDEPVRGAVGPIAVAAIAIALVALGFLVI